jgi:linoleoyl-CoA desaturase
LQPIKFNQKLHSDFWDELRGEVHAYFTTKQLSPYANARLWAKMILLVVMFVGAYLSLYLFSMPLWLMWTICVVLGILIAAVGFNISHQAAHGALSPSPRINRLMGFSFNLFGMSDYMWMIKHNVSHHAYTNIYANDEALKEDETMRFSKDAKWYPRHRYQHLFGPLAYGMFTVFWFAWLDIDKLMRYNAWGGRSEKSHPKRELFIFWTTKLYYIIAFVVLPNVFLHIHFGQWAFGFLTMHFVSSILITNILQVEHLNEKVKIAEVGEDQIVTTSWAVNQLEGTSNFKTNVFFQWISGPVNYQIEHHLFPTVAGCHLPAISKIVETKAKKYGLQYQSFPSFTSALVSHYRQLKVLGERPNPSAGS